MWGGGLVGGLGTLYAITQLNVDWGELLATSTIVGGVLAVIAMIVAAIAAIVEWLK